MTTRQTPQLPGPEPGCLHLGDALDVLPTLPAEAFQLIIADPPYHRVLEDQAWDNNWPSSEDYLAWTVQWVRECRRLLRPDGLLYIFGQPGKREHVWLHACCRLALELPFHDLLIWDRVVGYNQRRDSFSPQYEMILALRARSSVAPFFDKSAARTPYPKRTVETYLKDKRYKNRAAREQHLRLGKHATNILRIPSLKGSSKEKCGHPAQKPLALIDLLVATSSRPGDRVLDPFLGSGTTAVACHKRGRLFVGVDSNPEYLHMALSRLAGCGAPTPATHHGIKKPSP